MEGSPWEDSTAHTHTLTQEWKHGGAGKKKTASNGNKQAEKHFFGRVANSLRRLQTKAQTGRTGKKKKDETRA